MKKMPILLHVSKPLLLLLFSSSLQLVLADMNYAPVYHYCIADSTGNYSTNSLFADNLNQVLTNLTSEAKHSNFYNTSIGFRDQVNGLYMCRGDATADECQSCVAIATSAILNECPEQKEAIIWYEKCTLRYSSQSYFFSPQSDLVAYWYSQYNVSNQDQFDKLVLETLGSLANVTAFDPLTRMFVTNATTSGSLALYSLLQCIPDLLPNDCYNCLKTAIYYLKYYNVNGVEWGRIFLPSCIMWYSVSLFYSTASPPPPLALPPPPIQSPSLQSAVRALPSPSRTTATNSTNRGKQGAMSTNHTIYLFIAVPIAIGVLFLAGLSFYFLTRKQKYTLKMKDDDGYESLEFDLSTIKAATNNFSSSNTLGEGGFGIVYKGILPNGQEIAVKRLTKSSGKGHDRDFKNEVHLVAKLQHRNLVRLLGFCMGKEEKLLIYEFVPNASLDHFLFDPVKRPYLNWEKRFKIIVGIARGLLYLHEDSQLKIVHRDLKSANILLDSDLCPKIADFGTARLVGVEQTHCATSKIAGTYGYMAPEYVLNGQYSVKSDVYSYGVMLLELVSGQRNGGFDQFEYTQDLLCNAWEHWTNETPLEFVDSSIRECCSSSEVIRSIHIGLSCIGENPALRPSMASVVLSLQSESVTLPTLSPPGFLAKEVGKHTRENF